MNFIDYYKSVCGELKSKSLYDAVSQRVDTITDAIQYLGDKEHSTVQRALAEIQMLIGEATKG